MGSTTTKWICVKCGYTYDQTKGDPDTGVAPMTRFFDLPDDWKCPICGVEKKDFRPYK